MGLMAKDSGGGNFRPVPVGVHVARCIALIDLGTQEVNFQGDIKLQHKALVKWEVLGVDDADKPLVDDEGRPLTISKRYTMSLSTKARLRADLAAWRGRDFTADELKAFDVSKLLGAYCMLNVQHKDADGGKTYANVASITPLPRAVPKPTGVHELVRFDLDEPDVAVFESFHEKLREIIAASVEWKAMHAPAPSGTKAAAEPAGTSVPFEDMEEVPF